jgi:C4-dicarboxylate transporter, DctM subunit
MFLAGILPGVVLTILFCITIFILARVQPGFVFETTEHKLEQEEVSAWQIVRLAAPIVALIALVLGGLYGGFFNPTEAGAAGAAGALVIALLRRSLSGRTFWRLLVETGQITVSVLFLILAATFFSRMLALSGMPQSLAGFLLNGPFGPWGFLVAYIVVLIILGFLIDSISIMLIMLPIALPVAEAAGFDLIWFGVITVITIEIGLLTPPFGLSVFTIKSALDLPGLKVGEIFRGSTPFVLAMLVCIAIIVAVPGLATWLPRL